jgi:hypothetical protein
VASRHFMLGLASQVVCSVIGSLLRHV